jgi:hypothetical protein
MLASFDVSQSALMGVYGRLGAFSPVSLFASNEDGVVFDPLDISTFFQDSTGTTPVTTSPEYFGLMLDKSKGLVRGPQLVTNGDGTSTTGWTAVDATLAISGGQLEVTATAGSGRATQTITTVAGETYTFSAAHSITSGRAKIQVRDFNSFGTSLGLLSQTATAGTYTVTFTALSTSTYIGLEAFENTNVALFDNISVRSLAGNHARQATAAARLRRVVAANGDVVLQNNEINDSMSVTFPNMGAACTVAFVTQGSVYLEEDITLNGAYTLPQRDLLGFVAIDRALSVVEKIQLIRYLASKSQGVTYGVELGAMALAAISAVDVFVYDTTKDTDGGDWINNTAGLGPQLVTNGDFATGVSGWTHNGSSFTASAGSATLTADNDYDYVYQAVTTVVGKTYTFSSDLSAMTSNGVRVFAGTTVGGGVIADEVTYSATARTAVLTFTATATTTYINIMLRNTGAAVTIDNIAVKEPDYSWYWETLNTATRGATRAFPAQAMIIAEAAKVTIYDATDPDLPMWMVFNAIGSGRPLLSTVSGLPSSVSALNGVLCIGLKTGSINDGQAGIGVVNFISEVVTKTGTNAANGSGVIGPLIDRNTGKSSDGVFPYGSGIVNNTVNDVAMTVLADAPIDAATGLQVPTIAVGTNGGTSVINNDGTVIDLTLFSRAINKVTFDESGNGLWVASGRNAVHYYETLPTSDSSSEPAIRLITSGYSSPNIGGGFLGDAIEAIEGGAAISSTLLGLVNFLPYGSSSLTGGSMLSYGASTYNTGWMHGDIKGAWLSSVDATDLVGTELVTNGDFATNIDDWSFSVVGGGSGSQSFSSGKLRLENSTLTGSVRSSQGVSSFIVGKTYTISADFTVISGNPTNARLTISGLVDIATPVSNGSVSYTFVAGATSYSVLPSAIQTGSGSAVTIEWDNITLRLADPDRSVNGNGLATYGTVTKTAVATGAELMAYSGFSASNYLEQPYNSDLDFGTGDFHVMGWVKLSSNGWVVTRFDGSGYGLGIFGTATSIIFKIGASGSVNDLVATVSSGVWLFATISRSSGVLSMYVNGESVDSASNTQTVNGDGDAVLDVGSFSGSSFSGSLALLRIGAGAPTAAQVLKAYNDELPLFQENGAATIFGASDAVTALAHDPDTDLLHVGTSAGRSVFRGLERINNTSTSISTAISASGGLIVEK